MNLNPAAVLNLVFNFLNALIQDYGVYLCLVFVWLSLAVIVRVLSSGLRRKRPQGNSAVIIPGIIFSTRPHIEPTPPPIIGIEVNPTWDDDKETTD